MSKIGIVVVAYNNVEGLSRLLESLSSAKYHEIVDLVISIDHGGSSRVEIIAKKYTWKYGHKTIKTYPQNLGLRQHILSCGNFMNEYSWDAMVVLEDDIVVAPGFYNYTSQVVEFYRQNPRIAGISLYKHEINILAKKPFVPVKKGADVYFMQYAQSWGQVWLRESWKSFIQWLQDEKYKYIPESDIPANVIGWKNSWLKYHIMYCISENKYFVYPYFSLTTNYSDPGAHRVISSTAFQVPMDYAESKKYTFTQIDDDEAIVYDAFFENKKLGVTLTGIDHSMLDIDLYGKKKTHNRYLLTEQRYDYKIIRTWGRKLRPHEMNIVMDVNGEDIFLYDTSVAEKNANSNKSVERVEYDTKGYDLLSAKVARYMLKDFLQRVVGRIRRKKK